MVVVPKTITQELSKACLSDWVADRVIKEVVNDKDEEVVGKVVQ